MSRRGFSRSNSTRGQRPIPSIQASRPTTAGSTRPAPRSFPPVAASTSAESLSLGDPLLPTTSTPEPRDSTSLLTDPTFLDDTNVSTIPASTTGAIPRTGQNSVNDRLKKAKQLKRDQELKALAAQMNAVLASVEGYEDEQRKKNCPDEQAKIDELKSKMAEKVELIKGYSYCLENIPELNKAQAAVDSVVAKRAGIRQVLDGSNPDDIPPAEEVVAKVRDDLMRLKSSLHEIKSSLIAKRISLPFDELEKCLKHAAQIFDRGNDHEQITRKMKKVIQLVTLVEQLMLNLEKIGERLEEKERLINHLASLNVSLMLYRRGREEQ